MFANEALVSRPPSTACWELCPHRMSPAAPQARISSAIRRAHATPHRRTTTTTTTAAYKSKSGFKPVDWSLVADVRCQRNRIAGSSKDNWLHHQHGQCWWNM